SGTGGGRRSGLAPKGRSNDSARRRRDYPAHPQVLDDLSIVIRRVRERARDQSGAGRGRRAEDTLDRCERVRVVNGISRAVQRRERAVKSVAGGYRFTGRGPLASTIHDSSWVLMTGIVFDG